VLYAQLAKNRINTGYLKNQKDNLTAQQPHFKRHLTGFHLASGVFNYMNYERSI